MPTPQVSFDAEAGRAFGLKIGDTVRLNILGRSYEAHISNFREIEWGSFDINFVMLFSEQPFGNVPHSHLGAVFSAARKNKRQHNWLWQKTSPTSRPSPPTLYLTPQSLY